MAYSTYLKYAHALIDVVVERDIEGRVEEEIATLQGLLADNELLRETLETPALPFQPSGESWKNWLRVWVSATPLGISFWFSCKTAA